MTDPLCTILISVYNGERYLSEQIDSLLAQEGVRVRIIVRDDGSTDSTRAILQSYGDRVTTHCGKNLGAAKSFLAMRALAPLDASYYAFCDADDVWLPHKLRRCIDAMPDTSGPAAVTCRMQLTDCDLHPIGLSFRPSGFSFQNALVQCVLSGAATVMNAELFALVQKGQPEFVVMHDAWMYLIATAFGRIRYVDELLVLYRQHGSNVFGAAGAQSGKAVWRRRIGSLMGREEDTYKRQARSFLDVFGSQLSDEQRSLAERFAHHDSSIMSRLRFAASPRLRFTTLKSEVLYRTRAAIGKT